MFHPRSTSIHLTTPSVRLAITLALLVGPAQLVRAHPLLSAVDSASTPVATTDATGPVSGLAGPTLDGGWVQLRVRPAERRLEGLVILMGARVPGGLLHAELPPGVRVNKTYVQCREVAGSVAGSQLTIPVGRCPAQGCAVEVTWSLDAHDWDARVQSSRLAADGYRLRAADVMPRLGMGPRAGDASGQVVDGAAPSGDWNWVIQVEDSAAGSFSRQGAVTGVLDFADVWAPRVALSEAAGLATLGGSREVTSRASVSHHGGE